MQIATAMHKLIRLEKKVVDRALDEETKGARTSGKDWKAKTRVPRTDRPDQTRPDRRIDGQTNWRID